jgi:hypothetical protein
MTEVSKREMVRGRLLATMPKGGVVAEIGVWEGDFSQRILNECAPAHLHLIDPWMYMPEFSNTGFGKRKNADAMEAKWHAVVARFKDDPRVTVHRGTSSDILPGLPDGSLDWVYIDGNHNEPFVGQDIDLCLQKVKADGVISGDDFNWMAEELGAPVRRAVEATVAELAPKATLKVMANQWRMQLARSAG